jgi:hypothetical protein
MLSLARQVAPSGVASGVHKLLADPRRVWKYMVRPLPNSGVPSVLTFSYLVHLPGRVQSAAQSATSVANNIINEHETEHLCCSHWKNSCGWYQIFR